MPRTLETYDLNALVGLDGVMLADAPALVCEVCEATTLEIGELHRAMAALPALVIKQVVQLVPTPACVSRSRTHAGTLNNLEHQEVLSALREVHPLPAHSPCTTIARLAAGAHLL